MERNPNDPYGTPSGPTGGTGANPQNTGAGFRSAETVAGREYADTGTDQATGTGLSDRARDAQRTAKDKLGHARETASEKLGQARETASEKLGDAHRKAHDLKLSLADKLDAQAERLRTRSAGTTPAYETGDTMSAISTNDATGSRVGDKVAGGMHSTAEWLRNNDMDSMKRSVEEQVRTNPGRSLLVAAVAGYLIGKAIRRR